MGRPLQKTSGLSQVTEQRVPCLGPRLLPPRAFLSAQGCLSDLPLNRVWKRVCVWGSRGQGACRGLHEGQGWVPGQPTNSDSRLVFCGGLSVPWKGTEGSVRHSVCPQQALHLGLNMGNTSPSKANSRHLPTHTKLLIPAHEPSTYHPAFFLKLLYLLPTSPPHPSPSWLSSSPSRISIYPTLFHSQQPGKKEHRPNKGRGRTGKWPSRTRLQCPHFPGGGALSSTATHPSRSSALQVQPRYQSQDPHLLFTVMWQEGRDK